ncbi:hypothetical protein LINPERPRIM_LOCUS21418 [Linum perenne]
MEFWELGHSPRLLDKRCGEVKRTSGVRGQLG